MSHAISIRIGVAAGASLLIHMAVFAAVGSGEDAARIAGGGGKIHFGPAPGSGDTTGSAMLEEASIRKPAPETAEPETAPPSPEHEPVRTEQPKPAPKPRPEPPPEPETKPPEVTPSVEPGEPEEKPPEDAAEPAAPVKGETGQQRADTNKPSEGIPAGKNGVTDNEDTTAAGGGTVTSTNAVSGSVAEDAIPGAPPGPGNAASTNYAGMVMQHLSRVRRPRAASPGSAFVSFTIGKRGELVDISITKSSRSARFDRDALKVVKRAAPFPAPPPGVNRTFSVEIEGE